MKYYTVLALLPCIPFSWALSLFLLDHGALILGVGKVAKIVALPCLWAYLPVTATPSKKSVGPVSPSGSRAMHQVVCSARWEKTLRLGKILLKVSLVTY